MRLRLKTNNQIKIVTSASDKINETETETRNIDCLLTGICYISTVYFQIQAIAACLKSICSPIVFMC